MPNENSKGMIESGGALRSNDELIINELCEDFEADLRSGRRCCIEEYYDRCPSKMRAGLLKELVAVEVELRIASGESPTLAEYLSRFPQHRTDLEQALSVAMRIARTHLDVAFEHTKDDQSGTDASTDSDQTTPQRIGRYKIDRRIGSGSFGLVFLAVDEQLSRSVAIKVPHPKIVKMFQDAKPYLEEARTLASLEHPHIVPVYDIGTTMVHPFYLVSKYVDGSSLAEFFQSKALPVASAVSIVEKIADALHFAHLRGFVHRDVKPENILLDKSGHPFLADFGIALNEDALGAGHGHVGTPHYMSPEQVRGEGHRVDGRCDVFGLGVVLYQLLTGKRPFVGHTLDKLFEHITKFEPKPVRQWNDAVPAELERICHRALAKRLHDRYATARDFADDLRSYDHIPSGDSQVTGNSSIEPATITKPQEKPSGVIPKGLRSFSESDAEFFLELIPGPHDRDGIPESIRFWKAFLEPKHDSDEQPVGVLLGPSGSGKTSFIRAGVLPRVTPNVKKFYVECSATGTETRTASLLSNSHSSDTNAKSLSACFSDLRRARREKTVVVFDQFEQWLNANSVNDESELVQALRQCDGQFVQCLLLVRDDFGMAVTRLLSAIDVSLIQGRNFATIDLFDMDHAKKVMVLFGVAFGKLPESALSVDQERFVGQVIENLAEGERVVPVRLSVAADLLKGRSWTNETIRNLGGSRGIGRAFLEDALGPHSRNPLYRMHRVAVSRILESLLPPHGTTIKGHQQSASQLSAISGFKEDSEAFHDVIRILDSELRLITPSGLDSDASVESQTATSAYQLSHDYLVPALREWLESEMSLTWRGRAELRLRELTGYWKHKKEDRFLPGIYEFINLRLAVKGKSLDPPQVEFLHTAMYKNSWRCGIVLLAVCAISLVVGIGILNHRADLLVAKLLSSPTVHSAKRLIDEEVSHSSFALAKVRELSRESNPLLRQRVFLELASGSDDSRTDAVLEYLYKVQNREDFDSLCEVLQESADNPEELLWQNYNNFEMSDSKRLRSIFGLAMIAPNPDYLESVDFDLLASQLVDLPPSQIMIPTRSMKYIQSALVESLVSLSFDRLSTNRQRTRCAELALEIASDESRLVTDTILSVPADLFTHVFIKSREHLSKEITYVSSRLTERGRKKATQVERIECGGQEAAAACTLIRLGHHARALGVFKSESDLESLTQFVHSIKIRGLVPGDFVPFLEMQNPEWVQYGLALSLGEFSRNEITTEQLKVFETALLGWYRLSPSAGVHSAASWLLRRWGFADAIRSIDSAPTGYDALGKREWFTVRIEPKFFGLPAMPRKSEILKSVPAPAPAPVPSRKQEIDRDCTQKEVSTDHHLEQFVSLNPQGQLEDIQPPTPGTSTVEMLNIGADSNLFNFAAPQTSVEVKMAVAQASYQPILFTFIVVRSKETGHPMYAMLDREISNGDVRPFHEMLRAHYKVNDSGRDYLNPQAVKSLPANLSRDMCRNYCFWIGLNLPRDWDHGLKREVRLPTREELIWAGKSGTQTAYSFGSDPSHLEHYAWSQENTYGRTARPVAELRPNGFGLFDTLGNVSELYEDEKDVVRVSSGGGSFISRSTQLAPYPTQSAEIAPHVSNYSIGLRLVIPLEPPATAMRQ